MRIQKISKEIRDKYDIEFVFITKINKLAFLKTCKICGNKFITGRYVIGMCSFECKKDRVRQRALLYKKFKNNDKRVSASIDMTKCMICKKDNPDWHHYGNKNNQVIPLCRVHHKEIHNGSLQLENRPTNVIHFNH